MPPHDIPLSPFAPKTFPRLARLDGVRLASFASGTGYAKRDDFAVLLLPEATQVAGMFTRARIVAPSVVWTRTAVRKGQARVLLVNAGNANAFAGTAGVRAVEQLGAAAAQTFACPPHKVMQASTGVIGTPLCADKLLPFLSDIGAHQDWERFARAIRTTDSYPKGAQAQCHIGKTRVHVQGVAKGSAMLAPDMATMLVFLVTDAPLPAVVLRALLKEQMADSFHAITIDGDTSTNDTVLLFATGTQPLARPVRHAGDTRLKGFRTALGEVMQALAHQLVGDGEGITKRITIRVRGAQSRKQAATIARAIANSPLVKTAIAGASPNWGRIIMAIGKAGVPIIPDKLQVFMGGQLLAARGGPVRHDARALRRHLRGKEIGIEVRLGQGRYEARILTSDLTHGYIAINAEYVS